MNFEWDYKKAALNAKKHLVVFDEAITCFHDPFQIAFYDPDHSEEDREIMIARSQRNRMLVICYTIRDEKIRIISARPATKREVKNYETGI